MTTILGLAWKDALGWAIGTALAFLAGGRLWRKHRRAQADIADKLDTDTPGGLGELARLLRHDETAGKATQVSQGTGRNRS